jgi:acyl-CoA synthetase (AMP-forming)/AMP-acid ligase II
VLPDGDRWEQPAERTFAELLADVHRYANVFHALGVRRTDGVALLAPNCDELITATLARAGRIAAPINSGLSRSTSPSCCADPAHASWWPPARPGTRRVGQRRDLAHQPGSRHCSP